MSYEVDFANKSDIKVLLYGYGTVYFMRKYTVYILIS